MVTDDEAPTEPEIPSLKCPKCAGSGRTLKLVEVGTRYEGRPETCSLCQGRKMVTRAAFREWHATTQGRPPSSR